MRFLSTARKEDETAGEKMVRANKRDSVYLFSPMDFRSQKHKTPSLSPIHPLTESSSEEDEDGKEGGEEEEEKSKDEDEEVWEIKEVSPINDKTIVKPIFRYLPNEVEIRLLFNQVLRGGF